MTGIRLKKEIDTELMEICKEIKSKNCSLEEWKELESCDMFQSKHYCGGFDADDQLFWFSYFDDNNCETYFKISLCEVDDIIGGSIKIIDLEEPK